MSTPFIATGNLLPGRPSNPELALLYSNKEFNDPFFNNLHQYGEDAGGRYVRAYIDIFHIGGWIPGVSTLVGIGRTLVGVIHAIVHLVASIFDEKNREHHLFEAGLGGRNIVRGGVEIVPVLNLLLGIYDLERLGSLETQAKESFEREPDKYRGYFVCVTEEGDLRGIKTTAFEKGLSVLQKDAAPGNVKISSIFRMFAQES